MLHALDGAEDKLNFVMAAGVYLEGFSHSATGSRVRDRYAGWESSYRITHEAAGEGGLFRRYLTSSVAMFQVFVH